MKKAIVVKRNTIVDIIAALLLIFFLHTLITTYFELQSLKNMLAFYTTNRIFFAWTIVLTEGVIAICLFVPRTRILGFILTLLYSTILVTVIVRTPGFPHDFGGFIGDMPTSIQYYFYGLLPILAIVGLFMHKKAKVKPQNEPDTLVFT